MSATRSGTPLLERALRTAGEDRRVGVDALDATAAMRMIARGNVVAAAEDSADDE